MVYNLANAAVTVITELDGGLALGSGVLIQPNIVLTAAHLLWKIDGATGPVEAQSAMISTGDSYSFNPALNRYEFQNLTDGTAIRYNPVNNPNKQMGPSEYARDFGIIKLVADAEIEGGGSPGYVGLIQDNLFTGQGGTGTLIAYPNNQQQNFIPRTSAANQVVEQALINGYRIFVAGSSNNEGTSGGSVMTTRYDAGVTAGVAAGLYESGASALAGFSPLAIAQIETWLSEAQIGQSPAGVRLYRALFQRTPHPVDHANFSAAYMQAAQTASNALGKPFVSASEAFSFDSSLIQGMLASPEFNAIHPGISNEGLIDLVYLQSMGQSPTAAQMSYWTSRLNSGAVTRAQAVGAIANDPEAIARQGIWSQLASPSLATLSARRQDATTELHAALETKEPPMIKDLNPEDLAKRGLVRAPETPTDRGLSWKNHAQRKSAGVLGMLQERLNAPASAAASKASGAKLENDFVIEASQLRFPSDQRSDGRQQVDIALRVTTRVKADDPSEERCALIAQQLKDQILSAAPDEGVDDGAGQLLDRLLNGQSQEPQDPSRFVLTLTVRLFEPAAGEETCAATIEL